jgi:tetratricopeptide (TPR) repeat protein
MYANTHPNSIFKPLICLVILVFLGCEGTVSEQVKLHSSLKRHHVLIQEGNSGSARVRLIQFMELNGETSHPLFLMGLSYHSEKKYAKAAEWFTKSTVAFEDPFPLAWHYLGWSQLYLGAIEGSQISFEHYLRTNPDEPDSLFALGLLAMESGDLKKAEAIFNTVVRLAVTNNAIRAKALARWADTLTECNDWEASLPKYKEAIEINPDLYEAWFRYAKVLQRLGRAEEADKALVEFEHARKRVRPDLYLQTRFPE